jgi:hypothetical protein
MRRVYFVYLFHQQYGKKGQPSKKARSKKTNNMNPTTNNTANKENKVTNIFEEITCWIFAGIFLLTVFAAATAIIDKI